MSHRHRHRVSAAEASRLISHVEQEHELTQRLATQGLRVFSRGIEPRIDTFVVDNETADCLIAESTRLNPDSKELDSYVFDTKAVITARGETGFLALQAAVELYENIINET